MELILFEDLDIVVHLNISTQEIIHQTETLYGLEMMELLPLSLCVLKEVMEM